MNFSNISLVQNKILCILVLLIFCVYLLFVFSVCTFYAFRHIGTPFVFSVLLFFFCTSLIYFL